VKFPKFSLGKEWNELTRFEKLNQSQRKIVFYAENKASMNHYRLLIKELTEKRGLQICYVTSVENDPIFSSKNQKIKSFYIGDGGVRTKFFLTLQAKILIMDMPDLEKFHIKRSKIYPVHYIYIFHSMFSMHSYLRQSAIDNYDTIFCVGPHHMKEINETEIVYKLKPKTLIAYGFGRLDTLLDEKQKFRQITKDSDLVIITPSYGENNLLNICGIELIDILLKTKFKVLLRPHFRIFRDSVELIKTIKKRFGENPNFILEEGVIPPEKFHNSVSLISDWSGISLEYAFVFERSVIFIDVPKKILNPDAEDIPLEPIEILIRNKIGNVISPDKLKEIPKIIKESNQNDERKKEIKNIRSDTVYNVGKSAKIGAEVIEKLLKEGKD
jgi:YidC/Oxa1 family membrane protein insertase